MLLYLFFVGLIAAVVSYLLTRFVRKHARRWGLVVCPDDHAESRHLPVALGGGVAVFLAAAGTFAAEFLSSSRLQASLDEEKPFLGGLCIAGAWIVGLGLFSDRFGMKVKYKLAGQLIAVLVVVASGLLIHTLFLFDYKIQLGLFAIPFTVLWLLGTINSLRLLDGMDGLATTVGIILCATITLTALSMGSFAVATVAAIFVGSLLGFLRFNLPPASICLGDTGSMLIGLVVGALAIGGSLKMTATVGLAAPLAIFALPMLNAITPLVNVVAAILHGTAVKLSAIAVLLHGLIQAVDRGPFYHRLLTVFGNSSAALAFVAFCCVITCAGAWLSILMKNDLIAFGSVLLAFFILRVSLLMRT